MPNNKTVIYARVSTDEQNVKQQIDYLKQYAHNQGLIIYSVVSDEESGTIPLTGRFRFKELLTQSKKGFFNSILIFKLDRLTRNWDDVTLIEKHFRDNWNVCKLVSALEPIDLSNSAGRFNFRVMMALNCYMPEDMREKQRIGIDRAKAQGKYKGGKKGRKILNRTRLAHPLLN